MGRLVGAEHKQQSVKAVRRGITQAWKGGVPTVHRKEVEAYLPLLENGTGAY